MQSSLWPWHGGHIVVMSVIFHSRMSGLYGYVKQDYRIPFQAGQKSNANVYQFMTDIVKLLDKQ